jgi:putative serine protease PepD
MSESDPKPAPRVRRPRATAPAVSEATEGAPPPTTAATPPIVKQRSNAAPLVAALAVGALVGGASGAGIAAWAVSSNIPAQQQSAAEPQTITVNDPDDVNVVNAVAAKAGPSVVTVSVSTSQAGGTGSGVILSSDGYVLTNNHVVTLDGESSDGTIEVTTADGHIYQADVVGTDPIVDLAVIKLKDATGLTPIEFGDVDALDVGDRVVAIGAPLGLSNTVTDGIVSALNRSIQIASSAVPDDSSDDSDENNGNNGEGPFNFDLPGQQSTSGSGTISLPVIQTDAAINPGNSGGALVNASGELVGINVAIANAGGTSTTNGSIGVGFAIPADLAQRIANELIENGSATHGLLGATVRDATSADGSIVGAVIDEVTPDSAAAAVGLKKGDIVTEFDGAPITGSVDLTAQVREHAAGSKVEFVFVRDGEEHTVTATLGELPELP